MHLIAGGRHFFFISLIVACTSFAAAQGPVSSAYHNTTARFNAYFYAKQDIIQVEQALWDNHEWNYSKILPVYPPFDTLFSQGQEAPLEDCVKKASISIQRHPDSKWAYDCYVLVGRARIYGSEFPEAIETFKYVNTKSDNKNERHEALVQLLRAFVEAREFDNAVAVSDYLKKERLNADNQKTLFLNRAHLYQQTDDLNKTVQNLVLAEALIKDTDERARINYIIGQIYQDLGFDSEAYRYYKNTLKDSPSYELSFHTKLNMAQVSQLAKSSDRKKIEKYFRRLLRDRKNVEYKDKIYYEMGAFELKQGNLAEALDFYKLSVFHSVSNNRQKAYSYFQLSELYYDSLADFEMAKLYYDSTASVMPQDEENYEYVKERQQILTEFVKHITTIRDNDSLLNLATMNDATIDAYLNDVIAKKVQEAEEEKKRRKKVERRQQQFENLDPQGTGATISTTTEGVWYFYNVTSVSRGQSEFIRVWGQRSLEDNWRRKNRSGASSDIGTEETVTLSEEVLEDLQALEEADETIDVAAEKEKMLATIPKNPADQIKLLGEIEESYYQLGNIYNFQLLEKPNAIKTFETMIVRFDTSAYKPEVLYQLYLLYGEENPTASQQKANQLQEEFPESVYAKLIANPRFREEDLAKNQKVGELYSEAYDLFRRGQHEISIAMIDSTLSVYEESDYHDNLQLLRILNLGRIDELYKYQSELNTFLRQNEESELQGYAQGLLTASEEHQINLYSSSKGKYVRSFNNPHYFIFVYDPQGSFAETIIEDIEGVIEKNNMQMPVSGLVLDQKYSMVTVVDLPGKSSSETFVKLFRTTAEFLDDHKGEIYYDLVITEENFDILYESKDLKTYLNFFEKYYKL
ncbi:MAG: hypothetical protein AAGA85_08605 [Bacteroidota bacterium]